MSENVLLVIFLIVWFGISSYLFYLDREIKRIKQKLELQKEVKNNKI